MGQAGIFHNLHGATAIIYLLLLLASLHLLFLPSCNAELLLQNEQQQQQHLITPTSSTSKHVIVPRDPTTSLGAPVAATATPTEEEVGEEPNEEDQDSEEQGEDDLLTPSLTSTTTLITSTLSPSPPPPQESSVVNGTGPVVTVNLNEEHISLYDKIYGAAMDAVNELLDVLHINNNSISVTVNYTSFCDKACSNETYAWGAPSRLLQIPAREGIDPDYSHPQILVKQFFAEWKGKWAEHDVDIQINHDAYINAVDFDLAEQSGWNGTGVPPGGKFWFKDEGPIRDYQIDMTYVILHELLHGVGIISSWGAYFTGNSPLRALVDDFFDDEDFWFASPSPYSEVLYGTGPVFVTHFQRNTIFDKYLNVEFTDINRTEFINLKTLSEQMRDFCVQDNEAFIVRFIDNFINSDTISNQANTLYRALTIPNTISFDFKTDDKSTVFNNNEYLNRTYYNMTLLTGDSVVKGSSEHSGRINNRPGLRISHLSDSYADKPDFIMTQTFKTGATLQQLVNIAYNNTPLVIYTAETTNGTLVNQTYRSPIGPGILRALDTIGYSTVLKRTDYTKLEPENKDDDNKDKSCELNRHYPRRYGKRSDAISLLLSPNNWDIICIIIVVIITTTTITPITLLTS